ncbi:MAG: AI-2E family transporter [Candidatus Dormibacteria bacterium]
MPEKQESAGPAEDSRAASHWTDLVGPGKVLVWLLIVLAAVEIFLRAQFVVIHLFSVLILFIFAAVLALSFNPVVDRMQRLRAFGRRIVAVLILYLLLLGAVAGLITLLVPSIVDEGRRLPALTSRAQELLDRLPFHVSLPRNPAAVADRGLGPALGILSGTVTGIVDVVLIIVISIYLLIGGRELVATMRNLFDEHSHLFDFALLAIGGTIANYVRGQLLMSVLMGAYTGISMALLGVHYAIVLGAAAAVLELLPIIGAPVAMVLAIVVALFQSPALALAAGGVGLVGHLLDAYVVGPRVNAHVVRLHPLVALAALLFGAEIGGILGALFAVPVAAVVNIFLGALYRSRRGDHPFTTAEDSVVGLESLPRLGDEIRNVEEGEIATEPVPRVVSAGERDPASG